MGKLNRIELKLVAIDLASRKWTRDRAHRYLATMTDGADLKTAKAEFEAAMARMSRVSR